MFVQICILVTLCLAALIAVHKTTSKIEYEAIAIKHNTPKKGQDAETYYYMYLLNVNHIKENIRILRVLSSILLILLALLAAVSYHADSKNAPHTASPTASPTASQTTTQTNTPTATKTPNPTATQTNTPTATASPTATTTKFPSIIEVWTPVPTETAAPKRTPNAIEALVLAKYPSLSMEMASNGKWSEAEDFGRHVAAFDYIVNTPLLVDVTQFSEGWYRYRDAQTGTILKRIGLYGFDGANNFHLVEYPIYNKVEIQICSGEQCPKNGWKTRAIYSVYPGMSFNLEDGVGQKNINYEEIEISLITEDWDQEKIIKLLEENFNKKK